MNTFAGTISFEWKVDFSLLDFPFFFVGDTSENISNLYFYGETNKKSSEELRAFITNTIKNPVIAYDISHSKEDKIQVFLDEQIEGEYMRTMIEGKSENFQSVMDKFSESSPNIVAIREAEESRFFWNKIIKVDIVY